MSLAYPKPNHPLKGKKNGACNRSACQSEHHVVFYNQSTMAYYCAACAKKINDANQYDFGGNFVGDLCINKSEDVE